MSETRNSSDRDRRVAKVVLALFPFSLWFPKKREGEKEQRLWLFASLLSDLQTDLLKMDGCKHLLVCSASERSQDGCLSVL